MHQAQHIYRLHRSHRIPHYAKATATPERVAIEGGSAGGLLMGAVTNMRPDLLPRRAIACAVRRRDEHHARRIAAAHSRRVRRVGQSKRVRSLRLHAQLLALRQPGRARAGRNSCPRSWSRPASTTRRSCIGSPQSMSQSYARSSRTTGHCCSTSIWKRATAARPGDTTTSRR